MMWERIMALALLGFVAPALPGVAVKTKSLLTGRRGPPLLQLYADLWKQVRKGAVYSRTTTWVFRAGPVVAFASLLVAARRHAAMECGSQNCKGLAWRRPC